MELGSSSRRPSRSNPVHGPGERRATCIALHGGREARLFMRAAYYVLPAALLSLVVIAVGCSAPSVEGDPLPIGSNTKSKKKGKGTNDGEEAETTEDGTEPAPPSTTTPDPGSTTDAGGTTPPPPTTTCATSTTQDACFTCCEQQHPQALPLLQQAFGNCACGTGAGNCAAECGASFCAGLAPSALCEQCLDASDTCRLQADSACEQNPTCNALFQCDTASGCAAKP